VEGGLTGEGVVESKGKLQVNSGAADDGPFEAKVR